MTHKKKEYGDYQTPINFCKKVCKYLKENLKIQPDIIVEPTCGEGNFLKSASERFANCELIGIEIDNEKLNKVPPLKNLTLINEDIFKFEFNLFDKTQKYLIIGNPPWITNTELSKINSNNLPDKSNFKKESGIEALTGSSNFDISESIILKMIDDFKDTTSTFAFLIKTSVARNVFKELIRNNINYSDIRQLNFNGKKIFKIDVDTCLLVVQTGLNKKFHKKCSVSNLDNPEEVLHEYGYKTGKFYSNLDEIIEIDGECYYEWRQGVKHDCSKIMELEYTSNQFINNENKIVEIENTLLYPLLKSSNLKRPIITDTDKYVIITQKKIKQNTDYIQSDFPKTWKYLNDNKKHFDRRKSSIYKNAPDFSIFGIGDYSFSKYKVAISGFYKNPIFSLVYNKKAMMLDDTCYFIPFDDYDEAYITMLILNSEIVKKFLKNIVFLDSKRPYTKKVLKRIDIEKSLKKLSLSELRHTERNLNLKAYITQDKLDKYRKHLNP